MTPKIAIVGAGPGGCMLARLLHQNSIPCTIFEGEKSVNYRSQGGTLDLHSKTGLAAIKEAGLYKEFQDLARYDGESLLICDKKQTIWMRRAPSKKGQGNAFREAPEIDRAALRRLLLESVPKDNIRWDHRLIRIEPDLSLHFENGNVERGFDLIVGADGGWSKARNLLSSQKPFYSGIAGYSMTIPDAEKTAPKVYELVNRGSVFAYSDGNNLCGQQLGDGSINVSYYSHRDEDYVRTCGFDPTDLRSAKQALREELHDWSPDLVNIVESTEGTVQWRNLYMLPIGFQWEHKKGVTLLGDAAHLMTPFAGIGVNTAFYDAMLLTHAIVEHIESKQPDNQLDAHIVEYEKKMWAFAKEGMALTYGTMNDMLFTPGAPRTSIESWILRHVKPEFPSLAHPLLKAAVYSGYFVYKRFV